MKKKTDELQECNFKTVLFYRFKILSLTFDSEHIFLIIIFIFFSIHHSFVSIEFANKPADLRRLQYKHHYEITKVVLNYKLLFIYFLLALIYVLIFKRKTVSSQLDENVSGNSKN